MHVAPCGKLGFPKELYFGRGRHEQGTADYLSCGCLLAQSWFDSKGVYFLSTIHTANHSVETPAANCTVHRRSEEFYSMGLNYAFTIENFVVPHQQVGRKRRGALQFRVEPAELLVVPFRASATQRCVGQSRMTNVGQHMPVHKPGKQNNRNCRVCARKAIRKQPLLEAEFYTSSAVIITVFWRDGS
ncbi:hypothetical protein LSH36_1595g00018 [Paralvinella palmiformis]|uniref:Uncharacterized protein n=1 Tax=Paralvinella palmiformis TaxID=53620 RepID=A0AAD9IT26_9ANNE|nr:hypothetical protein LSH36_1595g00018 [Paralvinella palmiformis]